jgi:hypothetical protein
MQRTFAKKEVSGILNRHRPLKIPISVVESVKIFISFTVILEENSQKNISILDWADLAINFLSANQYFCLL